MTGFCRQLLFISTLSFRIRLCFFVHFAAMLFESVLVFSDRFAPG